MDKQVEDKANKHFLANLKYITTDQKCDHFCVNDVVPNTKKRGDKISKGLNKSYKPKKYTKKQLEFRINQCKLNFCNKSCKQNINSLDILNKKLFNKTIKRKLLKNIKTNFITLITPKNKKVLKSKGAISYCGNTSL